MHFIKEPTKKSGTSERELCGSRKSIPYNFFSFVGVRSYSFLSIASSNETSSVAETQGCIGSRGGDSISIPCLNFFFF